VPKIVLAFLLTHLYAFSFLSVAYTDELLYERGLIYLKQGQVEKGHEALENYFQTSGSDEKLRERKVQIARILANAPMSAKLKNDQAYYAKYALKFGKETERDEVVRLHRILADHLFKQNQLLEALKSYDFILEAMGEESPLWEYSIYYKGWILVNQNKYEELFTLWTKNYFAPSKKALRKALPDKVTEDLGKFWMEYIIEKNKWRSIDLTEMDQATFLKGAFGVVEKNKFREWKKLIPYLNHEMVSGLMAQVLNHKNFYGKNSCSRLEEVAKVPALKKLLSADGILPVLRECFDLEKDQKIVAPFFEEYRPFFTDHQGALALALALGQPDKKGGTVIVSKDACYHALAVQKEESALVEAKEEAAKILFSHCLGEDELIQFLAEKRKTKTIPDLSSLLKSHYLFLAKKDVKKLREHLDFMGIEGLSALDQYYLGLELKKVKGIEDWQKRLEQDPMVVYNNCQLLNNSEKEMLASELLSANKKSELLGRVECFESIMNDSLVLIQEFAIAGLENNDLQKSLKSEHVLGLQKYLTQTPEKSVGFNWSKLPGVKKSAFEGQFQFIDQLSIDLKRLKATKTLALDRIPQEFKKLQKAKKKMLSIKWTAMNFYQLGTQFYQAWHNQLTLMITEHKSLGAKDKAVILEGLQGGEFKL
jgi:hypothetical protein